MEPPADIEQYSNKPSNTGQSSPTLSRYVVNILVSGNQSTPTFVLFLNIGVHITWGDSAEKFDVFIRVELSHFAFRSRFSALSKTPSDNFTWYKNSDAYKYFHFLIETVIHNEGMAHAYPCRFHSMWGVKKN